MMEPKDNRKELHKKEGIQAGNLLLKSIIDSAEDFAIFTTDLNRIVTSWNRGAQKICQYNESEIIGKAGDILFTAEDRQKGDPVKETETAKLEGRAKNERWHVRRDGSLFWGSGLTHPLRDENGNLLGFVKIMRDLTDQKAAEEALREKEEQFRLLTNAVPQIIWTNDPKGKANYFNQRWFEYTGLGLEESLGLGWQLIVHPDDALLSKIRWQYAVEKAEVFDTEYRLRSADGSYRWFIGRNIPLLGEDGRVNGWFGSATDIHDLKSTEQVLQKTMERLRVTLESASDYAIISLDTDGRITEWSKGAELNFGYAESEVINQYTDIIFTPEDRSADVPQKELETARNMGIAIDERWHKRKDGSRFYMSGTMRPIYNDSQLAGFVKVARDMTEQKLMEQQKDEFIGIASHELKTPVTSIKTYVELLHEILQESGNRETLTITEKVGKQIDRLIGLIQTLLDTTKIAEGMVVLQTETFIYNDLVRQQVEEFQRLSRRHNIIFREGEVPPVQADRERVAQVLTNLISNAIKYSPAGGDIIITTETEEGTVKTGVRDFGIGMAPDTSQKVFERFYRVSDPRVQTFPGMGLGLYIASQIVKRHTGTIWVESSLNEGSVFYFRLPLSIQ